MKYPHVSIAISNYNSSDLIDGAIASVFATAGEVPFDITVIDDASTDGGLAKVKEEYKQDPRVSCVQFEKNVGISALNVMYECMQGPYLMTLDADARLQSGALKALVEYIEAHPQVGIAMGNLRNADGTAQNYYRRLMTPTLLFYTTLIGRFIDKYFFDLRYFNYYRYVDHDLEHTQEIEQPPIACLLIRKSVMDKDIFDPTMYLLSIDVDLCKRVYDKGYKIIMVGEAHVTHLKSVSFAKRESAWRRREYYSGLTLYFKKHYPAWFPILWVLLWIDRGLRAVMMRALDREILR
jgi:GT2 family glycosyltransferase